MDFDKNPLGLQQAIKHAQDGLLALKKSSSIFCEIGLVSKVQHEHIVQSSNEIDKQMEAMLEMHPLSAAKAQFNSPLQTTRKTPMFQNAQSPLQSPVYSGNLRPKRLTYDYPQKWAKNTRVTVTFVNPEIDANVDPKVLTNDDLIEYSGVIKCVRKSKKRSHLIKYDEDDEGKSDEIWTNLAYLKRNGLIKFEGE